MKSYVLVPFTPEFKAEFAAWREVLIEQAHAKAGRTDHSGTRLVVRMRPPYDTEWHTEGDPLVHPDFIDLYGLTVFFRGGVQVDA